MNTLLKLTITTLTLITLTACNTNNGEDTRNTAPKTSTTKEAKANHPYITKLTLSLPKQEVNKDESITPTITATYSNNTTKDIKDNIEWIITPEEVIKADKTTLTAIKDTNVTIQAKAINFLNQTITSNKTNLNIYWEVNGHRLPPEPDPKVNNSTLLGIDSNNNGVRDDVERWIYEEYKDKHPIYAAIAMEITKARAFAISDPSHYKEGYEAISKVHACSAYYKYFAELYSDKLLIDRDDDPGDDGLRAIMLNTKERIDAYANYDQSLSGGVFTSPSDEEKKNNCPTSIKKVLK